MAKSWYSAEATTMAEQQTIFSAQDGDDHEISLASPTPLTPEGVERYLRWAVLSGVLLLPLFFGGVHTPVAVVSELLMLLGLLLLLWRAPQALALPFPVASTSRLALVGALWCVGYGVAQTLLLSVSTAPHPVFGSAPELPSLQRALDGLHGFVTFAAAFVCSAVALRIGRYGSRPFIRALLFSAQVVGIVALSHWFYDNGKLFWTFTPDYVTTSPRARWPFVNPNNLGHYLLPGLFLIGATITWRATRLQELTRQRRRPTLGRSLVSQEVQAGLIGLIFSLVGTLLLCVCIAATLSRGTWLGVSVSLLCTVLLSRWSSPLRRTDPTFSSLRQPLLRRRRHHAAHPDETLVSRLHWSELLRRIGTPLVIFAAVALFLFFLNEKGTELVGQRIEYGLLHSKDDIRWTLSADSWEMLLQHPLFGVGVNGWALLVPGYMSAPLSGINPVFLHSDPLQFLIEFGAIGALPIVALVAILALRIYRRIPGMHPKHRLYSVAILAGLGGVVIASFLDFPFHIPAIAFQVAVLTAVLTNLADRPTEE